MQLPLQITLRDVDASEAVETRIRQKVADLEHVYPNLVSCRVVVEKLGKHKHQGKPFNVRIDIGVPGSELVVNRDRDEDLYVALRDAFDAARRQLEDYARAQRGVEKLHAPTLRGRIVRMNLEEGFGFIETPDGREFYFSSVNVVTPRFDALDVGTDVQFIEDAGSQGPQAKRVSVGKHQSAG